MIAHFCGISLFKICVLYIPSKIAIERTKGLTVEKWNSAVKSAAKRVHDTKLFQELEVKLAKVREEAMEARRRYVQAREERESTAIQLQKMQDEFRNMMEDRNQSLQRWESTINQMELCKTQMDQCDKVRSPTLKNSLGQTIRWIVDLLILLQS